VQAAAARRGSPLPEASPLDVTAPPERGYSRSKWVAERLLAAARGRGAAVTVLRLGEVLPSAEHPHPNRRALTHLLLSAVHQLGVRPDASVRSDWTPVDYASARVVAAVLDRAVWGRTLHVLHPRSVDFAAAFAGPGEPVPRVSCAEFLTRLRDAAQRSGDRELAALAALLPAPDGRDEPALRRGLATLLTDNPALYRRDECQALEERWRLADGDLSGPIAAYRGWLAGAAPAVPGPRVPARTP